MAFLQHFLPGQPLEENGHDSIGLQAHLTGAGGNWVAGVELEATRGYLKETQASAISPAESAFLAAIIPQGKHYDYAVDAALGAAFADYQRQLAPGLLLTAGLRFETMQYRYDNRMLDGRTRDDGTPCARGGCRFTRPADRQDSFSEASPRLGLVYDLSPAHQLYAQATQGFRAPQATELYRLQSGQEVSRIAPVELQALEVGARGQALAAAYEVSLFVMRKDSFIYRESGSRQNVDNGETRHSGLEVAADWRLGAAWHASLAFTWARHEYANTPVLATVPVDGNAVDTAPETYGSATLVWTPAPAHRLELEWVHIGRYYTDPANLHRYPGHDLLHLRGVWRESARASIFYRITNLADTAYAERADHAFGSHRYFVGRPRSVFIGVELQL